MAQRRAPQKNARPGADLPLTPERVERLLPPDLAAVTPARLLEALPGRLGRYVDMLAAWNRAMNLTGGRDGADILEHLVPDSFELAAFLSSGPLADAADAAGPDGPRVLDLGAGAGLPGIPLRMVWERGEYTLVEAREKRALFLANALAALDLARTTVWRGPAEALFARAPHGAPSCRGGNCCASAARGSPPGAWSSSSPRSHARSFPRTGGRWPKGNMARAGAGAGSGQ